MTARCNNVQRAAMNVIRKLALGAIAALAGCACAHADCVTGAKLALNFTVVDEHTIILDGPQKIVITSFAFFYPSSSVKVLKDSFCDYASDVLLVDGTAVGVNQVTEIN